MFKETRKLIEGLKVVDRVTLDIIIKFLLTKVVASTISIINRPKSVKNDSINSFLRDLFHIFRSLQNSLLERLRWYKDVLTDVLLDFVIIYTLRQTDLVSNLLFVAVCEVKR
jgi:hypothetical protein